MIKGWLKEDKNDYEILPRDEGRAQSELLVLQVTTRSPMGALVYGCGGIVMDEGWLCLLGSGCEQMKCKIYSFNLAKTLARQGRCLAICSWQTMFCIKLFVINGGAFGGKAGNVFYCVPDKQQMGRYLA
ncbi:DUF2625 family protein [Campylobacter concisus]|uniref:DUF2625 family protein n=1 Tax=Campylobacter concisus TaxID=199 RepID=UPI0009BD0677|nr:DUF2625 family protein [Campylobacter concisus]